MEKPKIIVICGPTASGKTALSIQLAKKIDGEIVSADSMQIYEDMDIGTAKPSIEEMDGVKHYLIGNVSPTIRYSVANFKKDALNAIEEILKKGKTPIIVGGTGLYVDSLVNGIDYDDSEIDLKYRAKLDEIAEKEGLEKLYEKAKEIDSLAMEKISHNDKKRIFRVLEIYNATGKTKTEQEIESKKKENPYNYIVFAINMDREKLYERINKRVDIMLENGLLNEINSLKEDYKTSRILNSGIGYKEFYDYLYNNKNLEDVIDDIKKNSRHFAKRQYTFFNHQFNTNWFEVDLNNFSNTINEVINFLKKF